MIEFIFTMDYEIYGNGQGSLEDLVYEPTERIKAIFKNYDCACVFFIEVAELEKIDSMSSDPAINLVKNQVRALYNEGFELGLHYHPWWFGAQYQDGKWKLDYNAYNICNLPEERINEVIDRSCEYLKKLSGSAEFIPFSYRAGHLIFQPTELVAKILAKKGVRVDSSVYKGGFSHQLNIDYRPSINNGYFWRFTDSVNIADPNGVLLELPIYTQMVPTWKIFTAKRVSMQKKDSSAADLGKQIAKRFSNYLRLTYPLKLDICSMTLGELTRVVDSVIHEDRKNPSIYRPIVAIGHTKELVDYNAIDRFLDYLKSKNISISTFPDAFKKCEVSLAA